MIYFTKKKMLFIDYETVVRGTVFRQANSLANLYYVVLKIVILD